MDGLQSEGMTYIVQTFPMDLWMRVVRPSRPSTVIGPAHVPCPYAFSGGSFVLPDPEHSEFVPNKRVRHCYPKFISQYI